MRGGRFPVLRCSFSSARVLGPGRKTRRLALPRGYIFTFLKSAVSSCTTRANTTITRHFRAVAGACPVCIMGGSNRRFYLYRTPLKTPTTTRFVSYLVTYKYEGVIATNSYNILARVTRGRFLVPAGTLQSRNASCRCLPTTQCTRPTPRTIRTVRGAFHTLNLPFHRYVA